MYLVTIPASFLSPEPEGTNNIGKMLWRTPGLLCPGSIMQTCFRHWHKLIVMQQPEAQRFGTWRHTGDSMVSAPALQDQH